MSISSELHAIGRPLLDAQLAHPTVRGIAHGDLPEPVFRSWLEQDYLFLHDYVRVFSRLAWQAPAAHLGDLVDLAHATYHEELDLHRSLSAEFGADLEGAKKGPACEAYTRFLLESAANYAEGLAALYPCMWGYSTLGQILAENPPTEPRYRKWVDTYADPGFAALAARIGQMIDEAAPDLERAKALFTEGVAHELAFWDVP
ncbi:thiaminase (transcriptional activator TenA) [Sinosporangium album]|uniref:Thiaminase (Transcriptional activator TenA) n=1 Tax=Sinosporangium album TaxID=504805 RepID=A0A1G8FTP7_9ACTN|nr:transcriptional regulator [Sinosporangium album]SDH85346.1 thiaminase (transcriptional activator TenA) [Sinosporangium album]